MEKEIRGTMAIEVDTSSNEEFYNELTRKTWLNFGLKESSGQSGIAPPLRGSHLKARHLVRK